MVKRIVASLVLVCAMPLLARAGITIEPIVLNAGTPKSTPAVTNYTVSGDMMVGIKVTAYIGGVAEPTLTWSLHGGENSNPGVMESIGYPGFGYWSLFQVGDTFDHDW